LIPSVLITNFWGLGASRSVERRLERFANAALTTVGPGGISASAFTLPVATSASPFPQLGTFRVLVEDEVLAVTHVPDATHFRVVRGVEGTPVAAHAPGAAVRQLVTGGALRQFGADQLGSGATENLPPAARPGMMFLPTDSPTPAVYDGSAWQGAGLLSTFTKPPAAGTWTALNSPQALTSYQGSLLYPGTAVSGDSVRGYYRQAPTAPYTVDVAFTLSTPMVGSWFGGVLWLDSSAGKITTLGVGLPGTTPTAWWQSLKYNSATSYNSYYDFKHNNNKVALGGLYAGVHWARLTDDGTNRRLALSSNGLDWSEILSVVRTDWHTPDRVGFFINSTTTSWAGSLRLLSWRVH
jgi:hypothetical protein